MSTRIFVVDDGKDILQTVQAYLEQSEFEVTEEIGLTQTELVADKTIETTGSGYRCAT